jgi:hypothetical protein
MEPGRHTPINQDQNGVKEPVLRTEQGFLPSFEYAYPILIDAFRRKCASFDKIMKNHKQRMDETRERYKAIFKD